MHHSSSKNGRAEQSLNASPGFGGNGAKEQDKRVQELLKSNEAIQQDLRKATEKYLNQRVDNTKLRDEIQMLQAQLDHLQAKKAPTNATLPP